MEYEECEYCGKIIICKHCKHQIHIFWYRARTIVYVEDVDRGNRITCDKRPYTTDPMFHEPEAPWDEEELHHTVVDEATQHPLDFIEQAARNIKNGRKSG